MSGESPFDQDCRALLLVRFLLLFILKVHRAACRRRVVKMHVSAILTQIWRCFDPHWTRGFRKCRTKVHPFCTSWKSPPRVALQLRPSQNHLRLLCLDNEKERTTHVFNNRQEGGIPLMGQHLSVTERYTHLEEPDTGMGMRDTNISDTNCSGCPCCHRDINIFMRRQSLLLLKPTCYAWYILNLSPRLGQWNSDRGFFALLDISFYFASSKLEFGSLFRRLTLPLSR